MRTSLTEQYGVPKGCCLAIGWTVLIGLGVGLVSARDGTAFLHVGPGGDAQFFGFPIDSWGRWAGVVLYGACSQIVRSLISATLYPFMTNVVRDHKEPWEDGSLRIALAVTVVYKLFYAVSDICDVFVALTLQLQYYVPMIVSDVAVGLFTTRWYMRRKRG